MATLKNLTVNDTGFIQIASGTTGDRPGSPVAGMIRYNTTTARNELYDGAKWVTFEGSTGQATGGSVTTPGGYRIHTFTSGTNTFTMTYPGVVEILMVGGGGGGGGIGGGGGAGGFVYESQVQLPAASYTVTVGGGGGGEPSHNSIAAPGNSSSIVGPAIPGQYEAVGGGRGLPYSQGATSGARFGNGGSGGGGPGGHNNAEGGFWPQAPTGHGSSPNNHWHQGPMVNIGHPWGSSNSTGRDQISMEGNGYGSGIVGQGHPGGHGAHGGGFDWAAGNTVIHAGGGGGGAGSSGKPIANSQAIATGGAGLSSQITGTVTRYAGGGGGGTHGPGNPGHYGLNGAYGPAAMATAFGGGRSGIHPGSPEGAANGGTGTTNSGGGGGGGVHGTPDVSGPGGPGVVVIRYRDV